MACLAMHLAISQKYLQIHKYEVESEFIDGTLAPDLKSDKIASHFGESKRPTSVKEMMDFKMDIVKAAKQINLDSSFSRAEFLHLISDDIFYRFVYSDKLEQWSPEEVKQAMYEDFDFVTYYILSKYNIELPESLKHLATDKKGESRFFTPDSIDRFISTISAIDLEYAKQQILTDLPKFRLEVLTRLNTKKQVKGK